MSENIGERRAQALGVEERLARSGGRIHPMDDRVPGRAVRVPEGLAVPEPPRAHGPALHERREGHELAEPGEPVLGGLLARRRCAERHRGDQGKRGEGADVPGGLNLRFHLTYLTLRAHTVIFPGVPPPDSVPTLMLVGANCVVAGVQ